MRGLGCWYLAALLFISTNLSAKSAQEMVNETSKSVVAIQVFDGQLKLLSMSVGIVVGQGQILISCTNKTRQAQFFSVGNTDDALFRTAILKSANPTWSLCLLESPKLNLPVASIGTTSTLRPDFPVYVVGDAQAPETIKFPFVSGVLLGDFKRKIIFLGSVSEAVSAGAGVFDGEGNLMGVTAFHKEKEGEPNFIVTAETLADFIKSANMEGNAVKETLTQTVTSESAPFLPKWMPIFSVETQDLATVYVETDSVKQDSEGLVTALILFDFSEKQYDEEAKIQFQSEIYLVEHDCKRGVAHSIKTLTYARFQEAMGGGQPLSIYGMSIFEMESYDALGQFEDRLTRKVCTLR